MEPPSDPPFPVLLNAAHRTYTAAIQSALARAGFEDMPLTGYRVAVALARAGSGVQDLADRLEVSKQATSRLIDLMVRRGYCRRDEDAGDRRRTTVVLTERGRAAAREIRKVIGRLNQDLAARADPADITAAKATLATVVEMGRSVRLAAESLP